MFWKYTQFETKLLWHNRKNLFIALFLLLFYFIFFIYYNQGEQLTLKQQKYEEQGIMNATFEYVDYLRDEVPKVEEVYQLLTEQSSLINYQVFYLGVGDDQAQYIENGLELNQLRLKVHELGNEGIPNHLIKPKDEILKENAILHYIKKHQLPIEDDSFATNDFFVKAQQAMSGLLLLVVALIAGSELLIYEQRHQSVVKGFPLPFMKKVNQKVAVHFVHVYSLLIVGFFIGTIYAASTLQASNFSFPVLIYVNESYIAVSTLQYLLYVFLGFAIVLTLLLYVSVLLNMLFRNAFANLLVGLGIFFLPDLLTATGISPKILAPIKYMDIAKVLSGELAIQFGNSTIDYWHAITWLGGLLILVVSIIYGMNRWTYHRQPKDMPLEKAF
ncbi:hypothetical protein [Virgibacillus sp. MG-45]|uniref:hypothetical protein n=1 Tax=Virgibacillus sp. MG-45 TaxID=3102791 RepID=UPI002EDB4551